MGKQLIISRGAPVIDEDGCHARGCPCARCDAGYGPTDFERSRARQARQERERRAVEAAAAAAEPKSAKAARRLELERAAELELEATAAAIRRSQEAGRRAAADARAARLLELRRAGWSFEDAFAEIDRTHPLPTREDDHEKTDDQ